MKPYTLEEIRSRLALSSPIDFETEQALAFVADLTGEIRSSDPIVPLETIGRAIQYREEKREDDWTALLIRDWEEREAKSYT